jgi:hypothetical protein
VALAGVIVVKATKALTASKALGSPKQQHQRNASCCDAAGLQLPTMSSLTAAH